MSSRAERKRRAKEQQRAFAVPAGTSIRVIPGSEQGVEQYEVQIEARNLPEPERNFYANVVTSIRFGNVLSFVFGQLEPGFLDSVNTAIAIDMPSSAVVAVVSSFDSTFRERLVSTQSLHPYPKSNEMPKNSLSYAGHIAKLLANDSMGALDFYELTPVSFGPPSITPTIRIKSLPAVVSYFVGECDRFVKGM